MIIIDRLTKGLLAGLAGGIVMAVFDLILTALGWVRFPYYDWGLALIHGSTAETLFEAVVGQIAHLLFAGMIGVGFAFVLPQISSRNRWIKGWLLGISVWFSVHVIVNLFGFQPLKPIPISQMISDFITATIYGLVLVEALHYLSPEKA